MTKEVTSVDVKFGDVTITDKGDVGVGSVANAVEVYEAMLEEAGIDKTHVKKVSEVSKKYLAELAAHAGTSAVDHMAGNKDIEKVTFDTKPSNDAGTFKVAVARSAVTRNPTTGEESTVYGALTVGHTHTYGKASSSVMSTVRDQLRELGAKKLAD